MLESVLHKLIPEEMNTFAKLERGDGRPYHFDCWKKDRSGSQCIYYWFFANDQVKKNKVVAAHFGITWRQHGSSHVVFINSQGKVAPVPAAYPILAVYVGNFLKLLGKRDARHR